MGGAGSVAKAAPMGSWQMPGTAGGAGQIQYYSGGSPFWKAALFVTAGHAAR